LFRIKSIIASENKLSQNRLFVFFSLIVLFGLLLGPALIQVRIELRWLQASFAILVLLTALISTEILSLNNKMKTMVLTGISTLFALTNYIYLTKGAMNLYFSTSARVGAAFDQAIKNGTIHKNATKLYLWEKHRVADRENEINWALMGGYFFKLYQPGIPQMIYFDSVYQKSDSGFVYALPNFNKNSEQVILLRIENDNQTFKYYLRDITSEYLRDSLRSFKE